MVYQLAVLIIIPIILSIVTVTPYEKPAKEDEQVVSPESKANVRVVFFILSMIWLLFLMRILYQLKKGTFKIRTKF